MRVDVHEVGMEALVNAVYLTAVNDYAQALVAHDRGGEISCRAFLMSGAFCQNPETGKAIIERTEEEVKLAKAFVNDFLRSEEKRRLIPKYRYIEDFIRIYCRHLNQLQKTVRVEWKNYAVYLVRVGGKND